MIPTGHAQTLRAMPPSAEASPKRLPITSRIRRPPPATGMVQVKTSTSHCMGADATSSVRDSEGCAPQPSRVSARDGTAACLSHPDCTVGTGIPPVRPRSRTLG